MRPPRFHQGRGLPPAAVRAPRGRTAHKEARVTPGPVQRARDRRANAGAPILSPYGAFGLRGDVRPGTRAPASVRTARVALLHSLTAPGERRALARPLRTGCVGLGDGGALWAGLSHRVRASPVSRAPLLLPHPQLPPQLSVGQRPVEDGNVRTDPLHHGLWACGRGPSRSGSRPACEGTAATGRRAEWLSAQVTRVHAACGVARQAGVQPAWPLGHLRAGRRAGASGSGLAAGALGTGQRSPGSPWDKEAPSLQRPRGVQTRTAAR